MVAFCYASPEADNEDVAQASKGLVPTIMQQAGCHWNAEVSKNSKSSGQGGANTPAPSLPSRTKGPGDRAQRGNRQSLLFVGKTLFIALDLNCLFKKTALEAIYRAPSSLGWLRGD